MKKVTDKWNKITDKLNKITDKLNKITCALLQSIIFSVNSYCFATTVNQVVLKKTRWKKWNCPAYCPVLSYSRNTIL